MTLIDFDAISEQQLRAVGGLKWRKPDEIGVWVAEMDFGIAPGITVALQEMLDFGRFGYPTPELVTQMQDAYSEWSAQHYGWEVEPAAVRPIPDVMSALEFALGLLTHPGSKVVVPTPAYMPFLTLPELSGHEVVQVPMARDGDSWVYDLDALDSALAGAGILVLCNPHNPIGRVLEPREMQAITEVVDKHGVRVFSDEIHAPVIYPGHAHVPYATTSQTAARHTVTATSASKAWNLPGLKSAQLVFSNDDDQQLWAKYGEFVEHRASNPGLAATAAAYNEGEPWLQEVLGYLNGTRTWFASQVAELIPGAQASTPEGTYLSLIDFRDVAGSERWGDQPAKFFRQEAGVSMIDGPLTGEAGRGFARFNIATTRPIIYAALDRMAASLAR